MLRGPLNVHHIFETLQNFCVSNFTLSSADIQNGFKWIRCFIVIKMSFVPKDSLFRELPEHFYSIGIFPWK